MIGSGVHIDYYRATEYHRVTLTNRHDWCITGNRLYFIIKKGWLFRPIWNSFTDINNSNYCFILCSLSHQNVSISKTHSLQHRILRNSTPHIAKETKLKKFFFKLTLIYTIARLKSMQYFKWLLIMRNTHKSIY